MKKTSYYDAVNYFGNSYVLCNNVPCNDGSYFECPDFGETAEEVSE